MIERPERHDMFGWRICCGFPVLAYFRVGSVETIAPRESNISIPFLYNMYSVFDFSVEGY